jgi:hypothetical protein
MSSSSSFQETWTTKTGEKIAVQDMSESHVRNVLKMLIRHYSVIFIANYGARYASGIRVQDLAESEAREMLNRTCADKSYLKRLVAEKCFGPVVWKEVMSTIE